MNVIATSSPSSGYRGDLMIVSWESTLEKLWKNALESSTVSVTFSVNVDRENIISPWNIQTSKINVITQKIQNDLQAKYFVDTYPSNMLSSVLSNYQYIFQEMLQSFIWVDPHILRSMVSGLNRFRCVL